MESINVNLLNASLGQFVSAESPLTDWPDEALAYYSEVKPEDVREGMENIVHVSHSRSKNANRPSSLVNSELGVITEVEFIDTDPSNVFTRIKHHFVTDAGPSNEFRQYSVSMDTENWHNSGVFYQRYKWVRVQPDVLKVLPFAGVEGLTLRTERWDGETLMTVVVDSVTELQWDELKANHELFGDKAALYFLYPKAAKVLRQAEAIPPMPGEKPQPGEQPGEGNGKPEGDPNDDIPPMPGEGRQSVDENKRGETTELGEGWWGTGRGDK